MKTLFLALVAVLAVSCAPQAPVTAARPFVAQTIPARSPELQEGLGAMQKAIVAADAKNQETLGKVESVVHEAEQMRQGLESAVAEADRLRKQKSASEAELDDLWKTLTAANQRNMFLEQSAKDALLSAKTERALKETVLEHLSRVQKDASQNKSELDALRIQLADETNLRIADNAVANELHLAVKTANERVAKVEKINSEQAGELNVYHLVRNIIIGIVLVIIAIKWILPLLKRVIFGS